MNYFESLKKPSYEELDEIVKKYYNRDKIKSHSEKRYTLVTQVLLVEGSFDKRRNGKVTDHAYFQIGSNDLQFLRDYWRRPEIQSQFDSTTWHYIYDNEENKLVETLSICI